MIFLLLLLVASVFIGSALYKNHDSQKRENLSLILYKAFNKAHINNKASTEADKNNLQIALTRDLQEVLKAKIEPYYTIALMQLAGLLKQNGLTPAINNVDNEVYKFYKLAQGSGVLALSSLAVLNLKSISNYEEASPIIKNKNENKNEINKVYYFSDKFLEALTAIKEDNLNKAKEDLYNIDSAADASPSIKELAKHVLSAYNL